jgi:cell division protein FtsB
MDRSRQTRPPTPPQADGDELDQTGEEAASSTLDLAGLTVAGLTRRRVAFLGAAFVAAWIVILFARQVGQASEASARLRALDAGNRALTAQVSSLQHELELIQRQEYIEQQARGYGLGKGPEIAFSLAPGAPAQPADAPGSASVRLGASTDSPSPLESWLSMLFGPTR